MEIDQLVMEMIEKVLGCISEYKPDGRIGTKLKRNHLRTIERAKEFITQQFANDISLMDIATYCHISPFHFSRIFKQFSGYSPYQYLQLVRLKHAETLLKNTDLPITDVCFRSGFNRLDYFSAAFTKKYHIAPSRYKQLAS